MRCFAENVNLRRRKYFGRTNCLFVNNRTFRTGQILAKKKHVFRILGVLWAARSAAHPRHPSGSAFCAFHRFQGIPGRPVGPGFPGTFIFLLCFFVKNLHVLQKEILCKKNSFAKENHFAISFCKRNMFLFRFFCDFSTTTP